MTEPAFRVLRSLEPAADPKRHVALPAAIAQPLGLSTSEPEWKFLDAALAWVDASRRPRIDDPVNEVVYQAYIQPFMGYEGEIGTLRSFIAHVPYLIGSLGVTAILLLPVMRRGTARAKGTEGSPFAVADHFEIDPGVTGYAAKRHAERVWSGLCELLGIAGVRLGMIVPVATLSIDSRHIERDPGLVFWWQGGPHDVLTGRTVERPNGQAGRPWLNEAAPASDAQDRFTTPPAATAISRTPTRGGTVATAIDEQGRVVTVANAYPDPVGPGDATDAWFDVAALRFVETLWPQSYRRDSEPSPTIASTYVQNALQSRLSTDGGILLADVSGALPKHAFPDASPRYPSQMFIAEQLWKFSDRREFEFVLGPLVPCVAAHSRAPAVLAESLAFHLRLLASDPGASWHMAGVGNHDCVPVDHRSARALYLMFCLLPRSVPHLFSGVEWGNQEPTNIEFGHRAEASRIPDSDLLLFSPRPVARDSARMSEFSAFWRGVLELRAELRTARLPPVAIQGVEQDGLVVSMRLGPALCVINCDPTSPRTIALPPGEWRLACASSPALFGDRVVNLPPTTSAVFTLASDGTGGL